ncbi:hypothetical protein GOP47_0023065 [Adiantum capillus-veneris]|uniref:Uncharacterized protein n=1 Tax=Adiantum capillus-veneris TaxID=13818 RepID=A0A9D4U6M6_ADICA|nr:hypothetical protein GOP47_0023065 [Adiantum capillus-veneris]
MQEEGAIWGLHEGSTSTWRLEGKGCQIGALQEGRQGVAGGVCWLVRGRQGKTGQSRHLDDAHEAEGAAGQRDQRRELRAAERAASDWGPQGRKERGALKVRGSESKERVNDGPGGAAKGCLGTAKECCNSGRQRKLWQNMDRAEECKDWSRAMHERMRRACYHSRWSRNLFQCSKEMKMLTSGLPILAIYAGSIADAR